MTCKLHHMMQILVFFYRRIYNLRDYSTYKLVINVFFALNLKLCKILRFSIPPTFNDPLKDFDDDNLEKLSHLTQRLNIYLFCFSFSFLSLVCKTHPSRLQKKKQDDLCGLFNSLI